jgi:hypothetical protein
MVIHRVVKNNEPLRQVADEYAVSHETIGRIMLRSRMDSKKPHCPQAGLNPSAEQQALYLVPMEGSDSCLAQSAPLCGGVANIFKLIKNKCVIAVKTNSSLRTGTLFTRFTLVQV